MLEFDSRPEFGKFVCDFAGLRTVEGERQTWTVAGHELTVELRLDQDRYIYVLYIRAGWPLRPARRSLCLAEVYAVVVTGTVRTFNKPELSRFKVRALLEAGLVPRPDVTLEPLPSTAPASAVETWNLIGELLEVRYAQDPQTALPLPLSAPWLAQMNTTADENTIRAGKRWLEQRGYIEHVGDGPSRFGNPLKLWSVKTRFASDQPQANAANEGNG